MSILPTLEKPLLGFRTLVSILFLQLFLLSSLLMSSSIYILPLGPPLAYTVSVYFGKS